MAHDIHLNSRFKSGALLRIECKKIELLGGYVARSIDVAALELGMVAVVISNFVNRLTRGCRKTRVKLGG